eukprot:GFKZ01012786.1.p1 GENE.GFKZ01012786.1~~GFKZ01012786.1.p1  ORF type:complete len:207 (+),score=35.27 GFKZ01012786.1:158-778(+)
MDTEYERELEKALSADLRAVEGRGIVHVWRSAAGDWQRDSDGRLVVSVVPGLVPEGEGMWERALQLFIVETREVCKESYRVVYMHSGFSSPVWFGWWVLRARWRLSREHRKNIGAVTVVHGSAAVRMMVMFLGMFVGRKFWDKVEYADRVEEMWLDNVVHEDGVRRNIGDRIMAYEEKIKEEAEAQRELAIMAGAPLAPREHVEEE